MSERIAAALAERYRIERELGQGGMATVYLAEDLKHHRKVAIKVLRPELAAALGPERFLREITITARLDHPHILPVLDSGILPDGRMADPAGRPYYVMPFVEGESLRERLAREKQLPIDQALQIAREVADALGYAHARGVIHRDIKPENILLSGGHARVADFGIARAIGVAGGVKLTETGLAVGTPTYMSPEQSMGEANLDGRSDLYALGCVLYEMLAGEPPYSGPTAQAIIAKRFREPVPRLSTVRETVAPALEAALTRVLAKAPADRFATAEEFTRALTAGSQPPSSRLRPLRAVIAIGAVAIVALLAAVLFRPRAPESLPGIGRTIQVTRDPGLEIDPALSPDGAMVAYAQGPPTRMQIYVQQVSGGRRVPLTSDSTDNLRWPRWSPDGTQIAYQGNDGIFVVPALGGSPQRVARIDAAALSLGSGSFTPVTGLTWSPDGKRLAYTANYGDQQLYTVSLSGGEPTRIAAPVAPHSPAWSPDGTRLALVSGNPLFPFGTGYFGNVGASSIVVVPVSGGAPVSITTDEYLNVSPQWAPDGRALYWVSDRGGSRDIYQVRLDRSGAPAGPAQRLTTGLEVHSISLAADGKRLAYSSLRTLSNIWSMPVPRSGPVSAGSARPVTTGSQTIEGVDISRDGRWLVFDSDQGGNPDIYKLATAGGEPIRLTLDTAGDFSAAWSPDGQQIAFHSMRTGNRDIFTMNADGTGLRQRTFTPAEDLDPTWSPGDSALVFEVISQAMQTFRIVSLSSERDSGRVLDATGDFAKWSPTGEGIAYHATEGLRLVPAAGGPSRLLVDDAKDGAEAFFAAWAPDGATLYYLTRRPTGWAIRAIPTRGGPSRSLVQFDDPAHQPARYGFTTDGRTFYLTMGSDESDVWVMELERR